MTESCYRGKCSKLVSKILRLHYLSCRVKCSAKRKSELPVCAIELVVPTSIISVVGISTGYLYSHIANV